MADSTLYIDFESCTWEQVQPGDHIWIDHYERGQYPLANPRIAGPFEVIDAQQRHLRALAGKKHRPKFRHGFNNILRRKQNEEV